MAYNIYTGDGQALSEGIQSEIEARRIAQATANRIGKTVYLDTVPSSTDPDDDEDMGEAIAPDDSVEDMTPVERLALALRLAIDAPAGREADADHLVQALSAGLSEEDIEAAKQAALEGQAYRG